MQYKYCVYDLAIVSTIALPYLDPLIIEGKKGDVEISLGKIPPLKHAPTNQNSWSVINHSEYICHIEDQVSFYVANGRQIIIEEHQPHIREVTCLYLMGHILGIIFAQREMIAIHSSSIVIGNRALLLLGDSGMGKSTVSMILTQKGYKLLSDDISVLNTLKSGQVMTLRGVPQQKICPDTAKLLKMNLTQCQYIKAAKEKYIAHEKQRFAYQSMPVAAFFEIRKGTEETIKVQQITGKEKLMKLIRNIYRMYIKYELGSTAKYMNELIQIARTKPYFSIERPKKGFTAFEIADLIEKYMLEQAG